MDWLKAQAGQGVRYATKVWQADGGLSWYVTYSDGWCYQGGIAKGLHNDATQVVTFPLPFKNAPLIQKVYRYTGTANFTPTMTNVTATGCIVANNATGVGICDLLWEASDYLKETA